MARTDRTEFSCDVAGCKETHDGDGVGDQVAPTGWGHARLCIVRGDWSVTKYTCPKHAERLKRFFLYGDRH
jgi:hypothetical protein